MSDTQLLPEAVSRLIAAANDGDWAAFAGAFARDGVLDGWGQHLLGRDEIARWSASSEMPAPLSVRGWFCYGDITTVEMDASSDESSGALTFVFELRDQRVRRLSVSG